MTATSIRIYAVGDIHGRFDRLEELYARIAADSPGSPPVRSIEIFLGDYVDRGPQSREVLDWLIGSQPVCDERICLLGNHETLLLGALATPQSMPHWLANGGFETLASYSRVSASALRQMTLGEAWTTLHRSLPAAHADFLGSLPRSVRVDEYLFVHAGVRPGVAFAEQDPEDLVWIRQPFLSSDEDFGAVVVHGHTPVGQPEALRNRINVDTGAFSTGRLTAVVLEGEEIRFLQTAPD